MRATAGPPARALGAVALRAAAAQRVAARVLEPWAGTTTDQVVDGVPTRFYRGAAGTRPLVVYLHGGGFVTGSLDSHEGICRRVADEAEVDVVSVAYRLAPEHPAPAAVADALAVLRWALDRAESGVALAGDSAGGTLALLAACRIVGEAPELRNRLLALALAYPNADLTLSMPSVETKGDGYALDRDDLAWLIEQWVPDVALRTSPELSPAHADLAGLPPTILVTCGHDPLRDEGDALAARLDAAAVTVHHHQEPSLVHGFLGLTAISATADAATTRIWQRLRELVSPPAS